MTVVDGGDDRVETLARTSPVRTRLAYVAFVIGPTALAVLVLKFGFSGGVTALAAKADPVAVPLAEPGSVLYKLLLSAAVIVICAHLCGSLAQRFGQPRVIGEMMVGFLLGPSVLKLLAPDLAAAIFPTDILPFLDAIAQVGVVLFMFLIGLELPLSKLRRATGTALLTGHASIAVPFLLGVLTALLIPDEYRPVGVSPMLFAAFVGLAMSVTAFPVLARILTDGKLAGTPIGGLGMLTAAIADVTAWCGLALVVTLASDGNPAVVLRTVLLTVVFVVVMWTVVRPLLAWVASRAEKNTNHQRGVMVLLLFVILVSALITDLIGVHSIFGAFLAGMITPRVRATEEFSHQLEGLTFWLMLPLFFAIVGLRTRFDELTTLTGWLVLVLVIVVAVAGKAIGTILPARIAGLDARDAKTLAAMMICRGLTEIVVLNIGLSMGLITPSLFAILIAMTLVTTMMTSPLLARLRRTPVTPQPAPS
ncbi:cation:proton antiporter [Micromonospora sp. RTGN7]|uniref:cation:proton antiporter n=1 Tax=Micromonospora sp. RTGN7 TaxID=3016526 RepID=UPI0029FF37F0|nr:cation:proton antiporter [Micromonospora sp. RTGN7]